MHKEGCVEEESWNRLIVEQNGFDLVILPNPDKSGPKRQNANDANGANGANLHKSKRTIYRYKTDISWICSALNG
ncbi:MAG: hypothetical protein Q8904_07190 [Bacteroidota bacterium]|nr:hypothetical protein [Bacteroidota bacterium]